MDNIHIEEDSGLDDSNLDLVPLTEKNIAGAEEDCSVIVIKNELQMERPLSSDSGDEPYLKLKGHEGHETYLKLKEPEHHDLYMKLGKENEGEHEAYLKMKEHSEHDTFMKIKEQHDGMEEAPVMQRKLFGPPCWNPEQLVAAIDSVKNGTSVSAAARKFGIPRTTLSNKIYGRRRKLYNSNDGSSPYPTSNGTKIANNHEASLVYIIGADNEKLVANIIAKQKLVDIDAFSMTRAIFDIVKYLACDKGHVLKDDEEIKEWIQYFFLRYPSSYFPVTLFELRMAHSDDEYFADFVFDTSKSESAEEVLKKLMALVTRRLLVEKKVLMSIHLFWWYTFLTTFTDVRDYFLDNLTWPDTILNHASLQMVEDKGVHQILISTLLKRAHNGITIASSNDLRRVKSMVVESSDSPTQVTARRAEVPMSSMSQLYDSIPRPSSISGYSMEDTSSQDSNNITSTSSHHVSLGKFLAQEALSAVERKLSSEELRYFVFRYDNPRLEDAYLVWKNLKSAADKDEEDAVVDSTF